MSRLLGWLPGSLPTPEEFDHRLMLTLAAAAENAGRRNYRLGLSDGVLLSIAMILGDDNEAVAGGDPYVGPLPDELRRYLLDVRARVVAVKEKDEREQSD